jgi:hypothetical protein
MDNEIELPIIEEGMGTSARVVYGLIFLILLSFVIFIVYKVKNDLEGNDISEETIATSLATNLNILYKKITNVDLELLNLPEQTDDGSESTIDGSGEGLFHPDQTPSKTCADINGTPDNPIPFDCENPPDEQENMYAFTLDHSSENIRCLDSGCRVLNCCTVRSGRFTVGKDYDLIITDDNGDYVGHRSRWRGDTQSEHLSSVIDLSDISDVEITSDTVLDPDLYPKIFNCGRGYKNSAAYSAALQSTYENNPNVDITDYERQIIGVNTDGILDFGWTESGGACTECDDIDGYYQVTSPTQPNGDLIRCKQKQCHCRVMTDIGEWLQPFPDPYSMIPQNLQRPTYIRQPTYEEIGVGSVGSECPRDGVFHCSSCVSPTKTVDSTNHGVFTTLDQPYTLQARDQLPISSCIPVENSIPPEISNCLLDSIPSAPANGQISCETRSGSSCNVVCDDGYHLVGTPPICEGYPGQYSDSPFSCEPNTCTTNNIPPENSLGYDITNLQNQCGDSFTFGDTCNAVSCLDDRNGDTPTISCEQDAAPITLSGCPAVCDASDQNVRHITRVPINIQYGDQQYRQLEASEKEFTSGGGGGPVCGNPGNILFNGQQCDIECPSDARLESVPPSCSNGVLSSNSIHCIYPDHVCSIGVDIQPPENGSFVSTDEDAGNYDCTVNLEGRDTEYFTRTQIKRALCLDSKCPDGSGYNPTMVGLPDHLWSDSDGDGLSDWLEQGGGNNWPVGWSGANPDQDVRSNYRDKYSYEPLCTGEETESSRANLCSGENDDWDNRDDNSNSTIKWFYDQYFPYGDDNSIIIDNSYIPPDPPTFGDSCKIKCNSNFEYVDSSLPICESDGQEFSGRQGTCQLVDQGTVESDNIRYVLSSYEYSGGERDATNPQRQPNCNDVCEEAVSAICPNGVYCRGINDSSTCEGNTECQWNPDLMQDGRPYSTPSSMGTCVNRNPPTCINPIQGENYYGDDTTEIINNIKSADHIHLNSNTNSIRYSGQRHSNNPFTDFSSVLSDYGDIQTEEINIPAFGTYPARYGSFQYYLDASGNNRIHYNLGVGISESGNVIDTELTKPLTADSFEEELKVIHLPYDQRFNIFSSNVCGYEHERASDVGASWSSENYYYNLCKCDISNCNQ